MSLGIGVGLPRGKYIPPDFAVTFNGVDEYLTLPLPNNDLLASPGVGDFYSSGIAIAGIVEFGTVAWNGTTSGKTYANTILLSAESGISKAISGLRVGQKYKLKIRYQAGTVGLNIASEQYGSDYFNLPDTFGEWNTTSKVFTAVSTTIWIGCGIEAAILDWVSVKHDQGLDANKDQEMILYSGDANFNNPTTRWVAKDGSSNQTCALSTVDKAEGTGSILITSTGVGDATDNYVKLPFEFLEPVVAGKKYILEGKARLDPASLVYGSEKLGTINFAGDAGWIGNATKTDADTITFTAGDQYVRKNISNLIVTGKVYKIRVAGTKTCGALRVGNYNVDTAYTIIYTATFDTTFYLTPSANSNGICLWLLTGLTAGDANITAFEVYEATPVTITNQIGTKSVNTDALSIVPGVFTKFVLNFEATASEVNADWKAYMDGQGVMFVDSLSLTQAYDIAYSKKIKIGDSRNYHVVLAGGNKLPSIYGGNTSKGYDFAIANSQRIYFGFATGDGDSGSSLLTDVINSIPLNTYKNIVVKFDRSSNSQSIYIDNVEKSVLSVGGRTPSKVGKLILNGVFNIGRGDVYSLNGQIAYLQIIRFDNISKTNFNPNTYQPGDTITDNGGGVPEVVLHINPKDGSSIANMLKDYSQKGHVITAVNIDLSNRVAVRN